MGPSGCGKTELLRALVANNSAVVGAPQIVLAGADVGAVGEAGIRARAITVPQDIPQLTVTAGEFLATVCGYSAMRPLVAGRSNEAIFDLACEIAVACGVGEEIVRRRTLASMSGGERQRAMLACAFALQPSMLILDEPTSALDQSSAQAVERQMARLAADHRSTVVVVSHSEEQRERIASTRITFTAREHGTFASAV